MMKTLTKQTTPAYQIPLPEPLIALSANRQMRIHHYMWHQTRNQWNTLTEEQRTELTNRGWGVTRPSQDAQGTFITDNGAGEDFLYMHRQMIIEINRILAAGNYTYGNQIVGWTEIPAQNDPDWPVPPVYGNDQNIVRAKSEEFLANIKTLETRFKDPSYLRTISLGELGARLEYEIHNALHVRFSSQSTLTRPDPQPFWNTDQIDTQYDSPTYDWMNDFYSSHVNVYFWKLHGWVDDRINDWQRANGLSSIQWNNTWMGVDHHNHGGTSTATATQTSTAAASVQTTNANFPETFEMISLSSKSSQPQDMSTENNININNNDNNPGNNTLVESNNIVNEGTVNNNVINNPIEQTPIPDGNAENVVNNNDSNLNNFIRIPEENSNNIENNTVASANINNNFINEADGNPRNFINNRPDVNTNNDVIVNEANVNNNINSPESNNNIINTVDVNADTIVNSPDTNPNINNVNTQSIDPNVMLQTFPGLEFLFDVDKDLF